MTEELDEEKMAMLRKAFAMFDNGKTGKIEKEKIRTILNTLGANYINEELETLLQDNDLEGTGKLDFDSFIRVVGHFLEEQDEEAMQKELKEAFRLYDKEGNGFIPTAALKEILGALDDKLTSADLDSIVEEIDEDGSGTVDFDARRLSPHERSPGERSPGETEARKVKEFMEMMTGD